MVCPECEKNKERYDSILEAMTELRENKLGSLIYSYLEKYENEKKIFDEIIEKLMNFSSDHGFVIKVLKKAKERSLNNV